MSVPLFTVGCSGLLRAKVKALLPGMNAAVEAMLDGPMQHPIGVFLGNPRAVGTPTVVIAHAGNAAGGINMTETTWTVKFQIMLLLPHIGSDWPSEFEMARQVSADTLTYMLDSIEMLTPRITLLGGDPAAAEAMIASRGTLADIFPFVMLDGKTTAEGFQIPWSATFSLTRQA